MPLAALVVVVGLLASPLGAAGAPVASIADPVVFEPGVKVYVTGSVRRPGVYRLPPGTRVADAIQAAGGAARGAAVASLELASVVEDGDTVRVPAAGERPDGGQPIVRMPESFDPRHGGGRQVSRSPRRRAAGRASGVAGRAASAAAGRAIGPGQGRAIVAINRASAVELQRLPGVGPGLAARIIAYRNRAGRFQRVEELREVQGIGEKRLARMAPHVDIR